MSSQWQLDGLSIAELLDLNRATMAALRTHTYDHLDNQARLDIVDDFEHLMRTIPGIAHELINQLGNQNAADELNIKNLSILLSERLHINKYEAVRRIADAAALGPGTTIGGQPLPAEHAPTGQAQRDGDISPDHADVILKFFRRLPQDVSAEDREMAEDHLVDLAKQTHPNAVDAAARQIEAHLNPDGSLDDERARVNKTYFRMKPQSRDKLTRGSFCIDAETRSYVEAYFAKTAKRSTSSAGPEAALFDAGTTPNPSGSSFGGPTCGGSSPTRPRSPRDRQREKDLLDFLAGSREPAGEATPPNPSAANDVEPISFDARSVGQRQHDALKGLFRSVLGNPTLGQHRGLPVTAVITMTLAELESGIGNALSGGGTMIPMREAIRMAAKAHHYLLIYDGDDGRPLHLGRAKRLASADQRLVLHATDRGCTFPGCNRPGYHAQTHHIDEWANGGRTDIDTLTWCCEEHHDLVGPGENDWATTVARANAAYPRRTLWHPPRCIDTQRRGRINHHHHPGEYLQKPVEFPGPG